MRRLLAILAVLVAVALPGRAADAPIPPEGGFSHPIKQRSLGGDREVAPEDRAEFTRVVRAWAAVLAEQATASQLHRAERKSAEALPLLLKVRERALELPLFGGAAGGSWRAAQGQRNRELVWTATYDAVSCLEYLGRFDEALAMARHLFDDVAGASQMKVARAHYYVAYAYEGLNRLEMALRELKTALEITDAEVERLLAGVAGWQGGGSPKACEAFVMAVQDLRELHMMATSELEEMGRYEEAAAFLTSERYRRLCRLVAAPQTMAQYAAAQSESMRAVMVPAVQLITTKFDVVDLDHLGELHTAMAREQEDGALYDRAESDYRQALARIGNAPGLEHDNAMTRTRLGKTLEARGKWKEAAHEYDEVEALLPRMPEALRASATPILAWHRASLLLGQPHPDGRRALALLDQAAATPERWKVNPRSLVWNRGRAWEALGDLTKAAEAYREAVRIAEGERSGMASAELKETFFRPNQFLYEDLIRVLHHVGRDGEAIAVMEQVRARSLADLLSQVNVRKGLSARSVAVLEEVRRDETHARQVALVERMPGARGGGEAPATAPRTFMDALRDTPELAQVAATTARPEEIAALLDADSVLLEYLAGDRFAAVAVLERGKAPRIVELRADAPHIRAAVTELRRAVDGSAGRPSRGRRVMAATRLADWKPAAERLYAMLLAPVEARLAGKKRLVVVPFDTLNYLPWPLLRKADGAPLLDRMAIAVLPSATVLKIVRERARATGHGIAAFALGSVARPGFSPLPNTTREVQAIAKLRPDAHVFEGPAFRRDTVCRRAKGMRVVHFATHGVLDGREPSASGILTADGLLDVQDIFNLDLSANLVVLSACETGLGKVYRGDEVVGLVRGFMYAGTPSVLATLWSVADDSTARFMELYYERLGHMDKAAALRGAQMALRREYEHPYFWAPFVLMGDWR